MGRLNSYNQRQVTNHGIGLRIRWIPRGQGHSALPDSHLLVGSSRGLHYHRSNSRELLRTANLRKYYPRLAGSVRCSQTNLSLDRSHSHLSSRQHSSHSEQRLLPSVLRLHSRRTSVEIALGDDFLRYWTGRQFGIRRLRRPRLPPVRRNTNNRLCGRCVWRSLRHYGHSSGSKSSAPANLPPGSRHFCRRWRSSPPWRTSRWAHPEKILVTWGRNFPGNIAIDSLERS